MNRVLWMNAAVGALAMARPLKNRTNGTLPPMTPMTSIHAHERRSMARICARGTTARATTMQDQRRDAVLERRVDGRVRQLLDGEAVDEDGHAADQRDRRTRG